MKQIDELPKPPNQRKYTIRKHLGDVQEMYGPEFKAAILDLFIKLCGCSSRKVENYIWAKVGETAPSKTAPISYLMVFLAIINKVRASSQLPPLHLADMYAPTVAAVELEGIDMEIPQIQLP